MYHSLIIAGKLVEQVKTFKLLATNISCNLKWDENVSTMIKKAHPLLFFFRQLRKFKVILTQFYCAAIESILTFSITGIAVQVKRTKTN